MMRRKLTEWRITLGFLKEDRNEWGLSAHTEGHDHTHRTLKEPEECRLLEPLVIAHNPRPLKIRIRHHPAHTRIEVCRDIQPAMPFYRGSLWTQEIDQTAWKAGI